MDCFRLNWETKIKKLNNIIDAWCHRDLSFKGRVLVINALLTSALWYNANSLSVPTWASTRIEQIIYRFFWSNENPLVNRDVLAPPLSKGGFNIARLETKKRALRLNTLRRLLAWEQANWKYFTAFFSVSLVYDLYCLVRGLSFSLLEYFVINWTWFVIVEGWPCFLWERQYVKDLQTLSVLYDHTTRKKTGTRSIPEVKPCRVRIVPGCLTAWKPLVLQTLLY